MYKKMKKHIFALLPALLLASCAESTMDSINKDLANPPVESMNGKLMITDAMTSTAFSVSSGDYSFYTAVFNEQVFGCGNNQFKNAEMRQTNETTASTTFNNVWNSTYANLLNLKAIIAKCAEGGLNEGQKDLEGMAKLLSAINWGILTDMHGDIPCSEALGGAGHKQSKLDPQESVYEHIFTLIDEAISDFDEAAGMRNVSSQDLIYGGDIASWSAAAHAVKARYLLHKSVRDPQAFSQAKAEAKAALDAGFAGFDFAVYDGNAAMNPWAAFQYSRDYCANSASLHDKMAERDDPRCSVYFGFYDESEGLDPEAEVTYGVPGNLADAQSTYTLGAPGWLSYSMATGLPVGAAASTHIVSLAEVNFILAECQARAGEDYSAALVAAVEASFDDTAAFGTIDGTAADYVASLSSRLAADPVAEIMMQKYIAQTRDENVEAYNDLRRCKAMGEEFVKMTNPQNTQDGANYLPVRLPYGNSDVSANSYVREAYGNGRYCLTDPVWIFSK